MTDGSADVAVPIENVSRTERAGELLIEAGRTERHYWGNTVANMRVALCFL